VLASFSAMTVTAAPRRAKTITSWLFRAAATLLFMLFATQPVLAGMFLSGGYGMLAAHSGVGGGLLLIAMIQVVAAASVWWPGRSGPVSAILAVAVLVLAVVQLTMGYSRTMGLHLPLGVTLVVVQFVMVRRAWQRAVSS
jgi:hypothetical protein